MIKMSVLKKAIVLAAVASLLLAAGAGSLGYRLYQSDLRKIEDFAASYRKFDRAMADYYSGKPNSGEDNASTVLGNLKAKSSFRISSLIRNDGKVMDQAQQVAILTGRELGALAAYKNALQSNGAVKNELYKTYSEAEAKRKAAYAVFRELGRD
jgi:hypothetical protein